MAHRPSRSPSTSSDTPPTGFHRNEMLYFAMGDHLELFWMQFPPMIAVLAQAAGEQAMAPAGAPASTSIVGRNSPPDQIPRYPLRALGIA
jgi:hypothetical protein